MKTTATAPPRKAPNGAELRFGRAQLGSNRAEGLAEKFSDIPGVKAVDQAGPSRYRLLADRDVRAPAAAAVVNAGGSLRRLSLEEPSLDAIYNGYFQNQEMNQEMQGATHANHAA